MIRRWLGLIVLFAGCAYPHSAKTEPNPVTRQLAKGKFPGAGVCIPLVDETTGAEREAMIACSFDDIEGAHYWARLTIEGNDKPWVRPEPLKVPLR